METHSKQTPRVSMDADDQFAIMGAQSTFSSPVYSDFSVVNTGGHPLLKFILKYLSRQSLNFSPTANKRTVT